MKEDTNSFHMRYSNMIYPKRLQSYRTIPSLWWTTLVYESTNVGLGDGTFNALCRPRFARPRSAIPNQSARSVTSFVIVTSCLRASGRSIDWGACRVTRVVRLLPLHPSLPFLSSLNSQRNLNLIRNLVPAHQKYQYGTCSFGSTCV